jgi:hypothetical protein
MNASVSWRESLNGAAEPGRDLLDWHENKPWRKCDLSFSQALAFPCLRRGVVHFIEARCRAIIRAVRLGSLGFMFEVSVLINS